jgi:hypothetical protein
MPDDPVLLRRRKIDGEGCAVSQRIVRASNEDEPGPAQVEGLRIDPEIAQIVFREVAQRRQMDVIGHVAVNRVFTGQIHSIIGIGRCDDCNRFEARVVVGLRRVGDRRRPEDGRKYSYGRLGYGCFR